MFRKVKLIVFIVMLILAHTGISNAQEQRIGRRACEKFKKVCTMSYETAKKSGTAGRGDSGKACYESWGVIEDEIKYKFGFEAKCRESLYSDPNAPPDCEGAYNMCMQVAR